MATGFTHTGVLTSSSDPQLTERRLRCIEFVLEVGRFADVDTCRGDVTTVLSFVVGPCDFVVLVVG